MGTRSTKRRMTATLAVLATLLVGAATLQAAIGGLQAGGTPQVRASASGSMSLTNSAGEGAIFTLTNMAPGRTSAGEVTISNSGTMPGTLSLLSAGLSDSPGRYGGRLSERLQLRLEDISSGAVSEVYSGDLAAMPERQLGGLGVGESRTYRFLVTMLDGGAPSTPFLDDNVYQRASTHIGYKWTLTEIEAGGPEPGPPAPPPPSVPPAAPPSAPPVTPSPPPESRKLIGTPRADKLVGSSGDDVIHGRGGADRIYGRGGRDRLFGGAGADRIYGGAGADRIYGGAGRDRLNGGPGADLIFARGGGVDLVNCGGGRDIAWVDRDDRVNGCERVP
jgi:hypothetical protein